MAWLILFAAGLLEIGWAIGLKYTDGFTKTVPSLLTSGAMIGSIVLLSFAMRTLPVGTAYAIWTGIGTVGAVILGIILFKEPFTLVRVGCVALIVTGMVGLKLSH